MSKSNGHLGYGNNLVVDYCFFYSKQSFLFMNNFNQLTYLEFRLSVVFVD